MNTTKSKSQIKSAPTSYKVPYTSKGSFNKNKSIQEQLGIYIYPEQEKIPSVLKIPKSAHSKISKFNDIDLTRWKEYDDIITDSLWLIGRRKSVEREHRKLGCISCRTGGE